MSLATRAELIAIELEGICMECLSESATLMSTTVIPSSAGSRFVNLGAVVLSEQDKIVARARAPAKPAFGRLKGPENRVGRRIVTLMGRVIY
jgi:hypothetical protein